MSKTEYSAKQPVESNVLFPYRFNHIIFVVSNNCTKEKFEKLLNTFITLEKKASEGTSALKWQTAVNFGGMDTQFFNATLNVDILKNCTDCYVNSQVEQIGETVSNAVSDLKDSKCDVWGICSESGTKKYTLVVSDVCVFGINENGFGLLMNNEDDVINCENKMGYTWEFFSVTNVISKDFEKYANMYQKYFKYPSLAKVNFIAVIKYKNYEIIYEILKCKIFHSNSLCLEDWHSFTGIFKIISDDEREHTYVEMSLPLYFNEEHSFEWFMDNYKKLRNLGYEYFQYDCEIINRFLKNINDMELYYEQYNVLIIEDSFSNCFDFNLHWRNHTMRRLEIIVLHSENVNKEAYINLIYEKPRIPYISYNDVTLNHLWLFNISDNTSLGNFCEYNTICGSTVPQWKINDLPQLESDITTLTTPTTTTAIKTSSTTTTPTKQTSEIHTQSTNTTKTPASTETTKSTAISDSIDRDILITSIITPIHSNNEELNAVVIIIGSVVVVIVVGGAILIWITKKIIATKKQNNFRNDLQSKVKNCSFNSQISKEKHWKIFVESKKVVIDFEDVRGKGAYATVFSGSIIETSSFHLLNRTVISKSFSSIQLAIKIQSKFDVNEAEEFLAELNSLIALKAHNNIVKVLGWSLLQETPILITELADTNLLAHAQTLPSHLQNPLKASLQYLWQISDALNYISEKRMIHRDVACRNILLFDTKIAKLADFGLCCFCNKNGSFKDSVNNKKFPIKWLSVEVLKENIFSEKSDVWAFGIVCYEVFSYGNVPYSSVDVSEMLRYLEDGKRLENPKDASSNMYELMLNCWNEDPKKRPTFKEINKRIRIMLEKETVKYGYLMLS